jgi:hypothetical protein
MALLLVLTGCADKPDVGYRSADVSIIPDQIGKVGIFGVAAGPRYRNQLVSDYVGKPVVREAMMELSLAVVYAQPGQSFVWADPRVGRDFVLVVTVHSMIGSNGCRAVGHYVFDAPNSRQAVVDALGTMYIRSFTDKVAADTSAQTHYGQWAIVLCPNGDGSTSIYFSDTKHGEADLLSDVENPAAWHELARLRAATLADMAWTVKKLADGVLTIEHHPPADDPAIWGGPYALPPGRA